MSQSLLDGGSGGWNAVLGTAIQGAGNVLAAKVTGSSAEATADQTVTTDISGQPTAVQRASVVDSLSQAKNLMMIGGIVLGGVTLFLIASK